MAFDAGAVVGRLEMGLSGWKKSVEAVKADQQSLAGFAMRHSEEIKKIGQAYAVAGGAIVGTLTALVLTAAKAGDNFDEMASRTGVSTETLSTLKLAADKSGTSIESVASGMKFLASQMVETSEAGDKSKTILGAIGVEATDAQNKLRPMNEVLFDVADRFAGMEDGALKAKLATAIFGKSGMDLIPILNLGSKGLKENEEAARRLGIEWKDKDAKAAAVFADSIEDLKASGEGLGKTIALAIMPTVNDFVTKVTNTIVKVREWADANPDLTKTLTGLAGGLGASALVGGTLLITFAKLAASAKALSLLAMTPIIFTVGLVGGAAVGKALEGLRDLYEKKHGTFVDDETKAWTKFDMSLGGWTNAARTVASEYRKMNGYSKDSQSALSELDAIWHQFGENTRKTLEAIAKGEPGFEKFTAALRNVGGAALDALLGETELKGGTEQLDPEIEALKKRMEELIKSLLGGDEAAKKLKKTEEDYVSFINSVGIYTQEQQRDLLRDVERALKDLNARRAAGTISAEQYRDANQGLNEKLREYGILVATALPPSRNLWEAIKNTKDPMAEESAAAAKLNTILESLGVKTMAEVARTTREVFREQMALTALYKASQLSPVEYAKAMEELEKRLRSLGGYTEYEAPKQLTAFQQAWANMITELAQGWSAAFVDMFGLTEALIGESTKHIQEYFDGAYADLEASREAQLAAFDGIYEAIQETYDKARDEVSAYYDELNWRADDALEDEKKRMRREYEDKRDYIMATVPAGAERDEMLKALARQYEDDVDALERQHEEEDRQRKADELAALEALNAQKKAEEEALAAEKLAIEEAYQAELARIKADEEKSREEHAANELKRQNSLWTKVKTVFGNAIEGMLTAWLTGFVTKFLASITDKIFPAMDSIGEKGTSVGDTAGKALSGIGKAIEDICTAILDVIEDIAKTVVDIVAYAIETLAESIAAAAKSLAAAAPDLLIVGAVALLLYAGFEAINALIGSGGGGSGDGMGRVVERQDRFLAVWDWWAPDVVDILAFIQGQNDHRADQLDNLAGVITAQGENICAAIAGIPGAAEGALVTGPTLVRVGENAPGEEEVILPLPELGSFARGMAASAPTSVSVNLNGPLIHTTGVSRSDLERAGEELFSIIENQARRSGVRFANA